MPFNVFVALRHGQSEANAEGVIVSDPKNGVPGYGLTALGRSQAAAAGGLLADLLRAHPGHRLAFVTSDFKRAAETAAEARKAVAALVPGRGEVPDADFVVDQRLRERYFGPDLELQSGSRYGEVWAHDKLDPTHAEYGSESLSSVARRTAAAVRDADARFDRTVVVLVSHGDTIQTLLSYAQGLDLRRLRDELPDIENCAVRRLASNCADCEA